MNWVWHQGMIVDWQISSGHKVYPYRLLMKLEPWPEDDETTERWLASPALGQAWRVFMLVKEAGDADNAV